MIKKPLTPFYKLVVKYLDERRPNIYYSQSQDKDHGKAKLLKLAKDHKPKYRFAFLIYVPNKPGTREKFVKRFLGTGCTGKHFIQEYNILKALLKLPPLNLN